MNRNLRSTAQGGFTLVELLIVAIILSILAAIVVPQFTTATDDSKSAALDTNLATLRSAIDLYYAQHASTYPGVALSSGATCPTAGTAGTGAALTAIAFSDQLGLYTNAAGQACNTHDTTFKFGPYLKKGIPTEPVTSSNAVVVDNAVTALGGLTGDTAVSVGWKFGLLNGQIIANRTSLQAR